MKGDLDGEGKIIFNGEKVYSIFKKISEEVSEFLGFNSKYCRPE